MHTKKKHICFAPWMGIISILPIDGRGPIDIPFSKHWPLVRKMTCGMLTEIPMLTCILQTHNYIENSTVKNQWKTIRDMLQASIWIYIQRYYTRTHIQTRTTTATIHMHAGHTTREEEIMYPHPMLCACGATLRTPKEYNKHTHTNIQSKQRQQPQTMPWMKFYIGWILSLPACLNSVFCWQQQQQLQWQKNKTKTWNIVLQYMLAFYCFLPAISIYASKVHVLSMC